MIRSDVEDQNVVDNISHNAVYLYYREFDTFGLLTCLAIFRTS